VLGFVAYAASLTGLIASSLAIHVLTIGGIGLITLSMMTRVSLGHTGRDVHNPPSMFSWIFAALCLAALVRFLGGTFMPQHYHTWIMLVGVLWVLGALLFTVSLIPILGKPRVDGRYG
ncbi:MAG: NnrS family protein, partial [bacterium]